MSQASLLTVVCTGCGHKVPLHAENGCMDSYMMQRCGCRVKESELRAALAEINANIVREHAPFGKAV